MLFHKYGGANVAVTNCMSHFNIFAPIKATLTLAIGNTGHSQVIGIVLCRFIKFPIIYPVGQFIIVQVTLPTPPHWLTSNFMLVFKSLNMNLLNIVTLLALKVVLGDHPNRLKKRLSSNRNCQSQPSEKQEYCCPNCLCPIKTKSLSDYSSALWSCLYC